MAKARRGLSGVSVRTFFAALLPLVLASTSARAADDALSPEDVRRLEAREIIVTTEDVPGHKLPRTRMVGLIQAPPEKVWAIIQDCNRYAQTMPRTLESHELERQGDRVRCKAKVDMPFPFGDLVSDTEAVQTVERGVRYQRKWTLRGGDFEANEGIWTLEPRDGGAATLVRYQSLFVPKVAIPAWIQNWATTVTMPGMLEGLRKQTE